MERDRVDSSAHSWEERKETTPPDAQQNGREETTGADICRSLLEEQSALNLRRETTRLERWFMVVSLCAPSN